MVQAAATRSSTHLLAQRPFFLLQVSWQDVKGSMVIGGSYEVAVKMMGDMNFLTSLLNFAKEQINDETVELLQVGRL